MKPAFKIKFGGRIATALEAMGIDPGNPAYVSPRANHWTRPAPYDQMRLTDAAKRLLASDPNFCGRDTIYVRPAPRAVSGAEAAAYGLNIARVAIRLPLADDVADVFDCTAYLNRLGELSQ